MARDCDVSDSDSSLVARGFNHCRQFSAWRVPVSLPTGAFFIAEKPRLRSGRQELEERKKERILGSDYNDPSSLNTGGIFSLFVMIVATLVGIFRIWCTIDRISRENVADFG